MAKASLSMIVIGLDGGSWATLEPLVDDGVLKTLGGILSRGARATLRSVIPPVTGPAWSAIATGLNLGRLGIYDFFNRSNLVDYALYPVRSHLFRGRAFWDSLSLRGYRIGIFNYPMLIPTYEINGWMVAGLGASKLQRWVWPPSLEGEIDTDMHPYKISVSYGLSKYRGNYDELLDDLTGMLTTHLAALSHLLHHHPVDVLVTIFNVTDLLQHSMWHLWDTAHPLHDPLLASKLLPKVYALWTKLDEGILMLLEQLSPSGHVLIISDHGFGSSYGVFHTNTWLEGNGYLQRNRGVQRFGNHLREILVSTLSPALSPLLRGILGTEAHRVLRASILREIDLTQTRAFALETTDVCGMIFINREYARLRSLHIPQFVKEVSTEIRDRLMLLSAELGLDIELFRPEEVYVGELSHLAPEIIFKVNNHAVSVSHRFAPAVYQERPHHPMKTGTHRQEGVFVAMGSKIRQGVHLRPLNALDVAPVVHHMLGESVPAALDGRVAVEAFLPGHEQFNVARESEVHLETVSEDYSSEEAEALRQRLKDLGYIE